MKVVSNTSPFLYLYRIDGLVWLSVLFEEVWVPNAVVEELREGQRLGFDVPEPTRYDWVVTVAPLEIPADWQALDLGPGELAAMALGLENPERVVLLDDGLARRVAQEHGLIVWGTLRVLLEVKRRGLVPKVGPSVDALRESGMWMSEEIRQRVLRLADEL